MQLFQCYSDGMINTSQFGKKKKNYAYMQLYMCIYVISMLQLYKNRPMDFHSAVDYVCTQLYIVLQILIQQAWKATLESVYLISATHEYEKCALCSKCHTLETEQGWF